MEQSNKVTSKGLFVNRSVSSLSHIYSPVLPVTGLYVGEKSE